MIRSERQYNSYEIKKVTQSNYKNFTQALSDKKIITHQSGTTPYSPTGMSLMDFFLTNPTLYFTPMTVYKSIGLGVSPDTIKNCMNLLLKNSYLTKENGKGTNHYCITKENMEFWITDFRRYILEKEKLIQPKKQFENLPVNDTEDDE